MIDSMPIPELEHTDCPLCASADSRITVVVPDHLCRIPGEYAISQCVKCRHIFMNPRPTPATLHLGYPEHYGPHRAAPPIKQEKDKAESPPARPWYLRFLPLSYVPGLRSLYYWLISDRSQPIPRLPARISGDKPMALELGCSTGSYLSRLTAQGWQVVGVEPGVTASERARACGFTVHSGTLDDVSLPAESFDCVAAWMVIEHVIDPISTMTQLHDLLNQGGQLLFSIPNAGCWERYVFRSCWYVWEPPRHLHYFTPSTIRKVLQAAGFVNVRIVHQRNTHDIVGSLGILLQRFRPTRQLGQRLLGYPDSPRMWVQLALSPLAHFLAFCRQGGRLTIHAQRSAAESSEEGTAPGNSAGRRPFVTNAVVTTPVDEDAQ